MMYKVRKTADNYHYYTVAEFETFTEAYEFCEYYNWQLIDENGFTWELNID